MAQSSSGSPRSILEYLQRLSDQERSILFTDAFSTLTLCRSLPPLAKQYLMRLINVEHPITLAVMERWCTLPALSLHHAALIRLLELGILSLTPVMPPPELDMYSEDPSQQQQAQSQTPGPLPSSTPFNVVMRTVDPRSTVTCNPEFAKSIRAALANQVPELRNSQMGKDSYAPTPELLEEFTHNRWQSILHYLVGSITDDPPPIGVRRLLLSMGLMRHCSPAVMMQYQNQVHLNKHRVAQRQKTAAAQAEDEGEEAEWGEQDEAKQKRDQRVVDRQVNLENVIITGKGFSFLFKDTHTQVWQLIMAYIAGLEDRQMNRNEVLLLLFQLAFLEPGRDYPTEGKTPSQKVFIEDLTRFGLLYQRKASSRRFYATPLTMCLSPNPPPLQSKNSQAGFLVIETTFRVYSFSTSPLQQSLLQMFVRMEYDLPSMMIGTITKASVRHALRHGISARDMVSYMTECAHMQQRARVPLLPTNVVDQLYLWEQEQSRLCVQPAVRYQFAAGDRDNPIFQATVRQLQSNGAMLWNDGRYRMFTPEGNWDAALTRIRQQVQKDQQAKVASGGAKSNDPRDRKSVV